MNFQPYAVSQSQMIGTYVPEQILRARVLDILPDRSALLQMGLRQVVAKIESVDPPLKMGQEYLFQIQQQGSPLTAKVISRPSSGEQQTAQNLADNLLDAFHLKNEPVILQLAQSLLDHGDTVTRHTLIEARALLNGNGSHADGIEAVRWMMQRNLPLTPAVFQIAQALNRKDEPFAAQLSVLNQQLQKAPETKAAHLLQNAIDQLSSAKGKTNFLQLLIGQAGPKNAADALARLLQQDGLSQNQAVQQAFDQLEATSWSATDIHTFLSHISAEMKPAAVIAQLTQSLADKAKIDMLNPAAQDQPISILHIMNQIGFDLEGMIRQQIDEGNAVQPSGSLKEALLAVMQDKKIPHQLRTQAENLVQKITGEQLQMIIPDTAAAQFALQLPIPGQKGIQNMTVYWEGRRDQKGRLDPDYCTLLLCLDLQGLKKTMVSVRVQQRVVTLRIQNDTVDLKPLLVRFQGVLADQLNSLNYRLSSVVQADQLDPHLVQRATERLTPLTSRLDVKA